MMKPAAATTILAFSFVSFISAAAHAQGQIPQQEEPVQAQSRVVTSVEGCLSQLSPGDAARVRQSLKPYEDCQKKLQEKQAAKDKEEAEKKSEKQAPAENARNFVRVQDESKTAGDSSNKSEKSKP